MGCVNWLRSRQEKQEINYWLSFAYDFKDKSLSNRLYLLYLIIFFSIWWFIVLVFFADAGASILTFLKPEAPVYGALALEIIILLFWWVITAFKAVWRSPVIFTEEDSYLVCQMPLKPQNIVLRWFIMPWIKNLIPVALLSATIGFSLAETIFVPAEFSSEMFANYFMYGVRILLFVTPIHLGLFLLVWAIGVWCLNNDRKILVVVISLAATLLIGSILLSLVFLSFEANIYLPYQKFLEVSKNIFLTGFTAGEILNGLLVGWLFALITLLILLTTSANFSPSRSAQETRFGARIKSLMRYGLFAQAKEIKEAKRLRIKAPVFWQPHWENGLAMVWKDILQNLRIFRLSRIYNFFIILTSMVSFVFFDTFTTRLPIIAVWTIQAGKITSERVKNDLSRWLIIKGLPLSQSKWMLFDLLFPFSLVGFWSITGMIIGAILSKTLPVYEMLLLPGMIAMAAGISIFDIGRRSRTSLLIRGQVPQISQLGKIGSVVIVCLPLLFILVAPGFFGGFASILSSIILGWIALKVSIMACRNIRED
jgi:hypothetical protein